MAASAAPLTAGNVLVALTPNSFGYTDMAEYTRTGTLVQSWQRVNTNNETGPEAEGVAVDKNLTPYAYIGQGTAQVWTVNPQTSAYSYFTYPGLSMVGNTADGQLTAYGHYLYATDFNTGGTDTAPNGIVRFDLDNAAAGQRFLDPFPGDPYGDSDFDKVTVGLNGKLYGRRNHGSYQSDDVAVTDPNTFATTTVVALPEAANALAVDAAGNYYLLRDGGVDEYNPSLTTKLRSLTLTGYTSFDNDIQLDADGTVLITSNGGTVMLTTAALASYTSFSVAGLVGKNDSIREMASTVIVAPAAVPEPATVSAAAVAAAAGLCVRRRRR